MTKYLNIKWSGIAAALLAIVLLTGCRDDDIFATGDSSAITEPSLVFDFNLTPFDDDGDGSGSVVDNILDHGEAWENYVDPARMRVIFCDLDGFFLFEVDRNHIKIISKDKTWKAGTLAYRVVISKKELYSASRSDANNEAIRKAIEEEGFKVAVLANWPNLMEGPRQRDPYTGDEMLGAESLPTNLQFVWVDKESPNKPDNSHISWLSHCIFDNVYGVSADDNGTKIYPYEQVVYYPSGSKTQDDGQMGVFSTWVQYIYNNQKDAALAIRQGEEGARQGVKFTYDCTGLQEWRKTREVPVIEDPEKFSYTNYSYDRTVDAENNYSLENIWRLWNFSAGHSCGYHADCGASVKAYWELRNQNVLIRELNKPENWTASGFTIKNHAGEVLIQCDKGNPSFVPYNGSDQSGFIRLPQIISKTDFDKINGSNGIRDNQTLVQDFKDKAIHFRAYGEGTLRVRARKAADSGAQGKIAVISLDANYPKGAEEVEHVTVRTVDGGFSEKSNEPYYEPTVSGTSFSESSEYDDSGEYIIEPGNMPYSELYIGSVDGDVEIYEIEFMRARHIYDSARNAIMPSADHPIPMYGIQNFDPIPEEFLMTDQTFNLSDVNENLYLGDKRFGYNYKDIFLLRSVAKVEIRFDKSVFGNNPPIHVMMRSMNRSARCEPKDVVNPTEWIWYGHDHLNDYLDQYKPGTKVYVDHDAKPETFPGIAGEMQNICDYYRQKPLYDTSSGSISEYRKRTAWFYGVWGLSGDPTYYWINPWNWNNSDKPDENTGIPYPRIFNTRIDRSDFCRFHEVPSDNRYIRYIMYVPEKNITDADSKGKLSASPKVQHIEIRFKDMNTALNFDDNSHYRIYFTQYTDENGERTQAADMLGGYNREGNQHTNNNTFYQGEKDIELLKKLQPIVRNCHYVFTVNSINDNKIGVQFSICGAAKRETFGGGFNIK